MVSAADVADKFGRDDVLHTLAEDSRWAGNAGDELSYVSEGEIVSEQMKVNVDGLGLVEGIVSWGGEGDGAATGDVIKVTGEDGSENYFERTGRYSSWDSTYYGDWYEVEPYEKTVTRYRKV